MFRGNFNPDGYDGDSSDSDGDGKSVFSSSETETEADIDTDWDSSIPDAVYSTPKLRRHFTVAASSLDDEMKLVYLDLSHRSNNDISIATRGLKRGKFRHSRARQMAAAARYGWKFTPEDTFRPEEWMNKVSSCSEHLSRPFILDSDSSSSDRDRESEDDDGSIPDYWLQMSGVEDIQFPDDMDMDDYNIQYGHV